MHTLGTNQVVLVHCNIFNNDYQQNSRVLYNFVTNKSFGQFLDISSKNIILLKTLDSVLAYMEVWFTDQSSKPLEIQDKVTITLVINQIVKYKRYCAIPFNLELEYL